jgi:hypothetical protein
MISMQNEMETLQIHSRIINTIPRMSSVTFTDVLIHNSSKFKGFDKHTQRGHFVMHETKHIHTTNTCKSVALYCTTCTPSSLWETWPNSAEFIRICRNWKCARFQIFTVVWRFRSRSSAFLKRWYPSTTLHRITTQKISTWKCIFF